MAYTTVSDVKVAANIPASDTAYDTYLTALITNVQAAIDRSCERTFEADTDSTRAFSTSSVQDGQIWLDGDLCALTTVLNGDSAATDVTSLVIPVPRHRTPWYALCLRDEAWQSSLAHSEEIQITGRWAYSLTPPADIVQAATLWVLHLLRLSDMRAQSVITAPGQVVRTGELPRDITDLLEPYRRVV